jgi:hypothetical protein
MIKSFQPNAMIPLFLLVLIGTKKMQIFARYVEFPVDKEFFSNHHVQRTLQSIDEECKIFDCNGGKCWQLVDENCLTDDHIRQLMENDEQDHNMMWFPEDNVDDENDEVVDDNEIDGVIRKLLRSSYQHNPNSGSAAAATVADSGSAGPRRESKPLPPCNGQPLSNIQHYGEGNGYGPRRYSITDSLGQTSDRNRDQLRQAHVKQAAEQKKSLEFAFFIVNGWNGKDYIAGTCQQAGTTNTYFPWAIARVSLDPGQAICNYLKARFPSLLNTNNYMMTGAGSSGSNVIGSGATATATTANGGGSATKTRGLLSAAAAPQNDDGFQELYVLKLDLQCVRSQTNADVYSFLGKNNLHVVLNNIFDDEIKSSTTLGQSFTIPVACIKNEHQYTRNDIQQYVSTYGCNSNRFNDDIDVESMMDDANSGVIVY